jgi:hypothetical protein
MTPTRDANFKRITEKVRREEPLTSREAKALYDVVVAVHDQDLNEQQEEFTLADTHGKLMRRVELIEKTKRAMRAIDFEGNHV